MSVKSLNYRDHVHIMCNVSYFRNCIQIASGPTQLPVQLVPQIIPSRYSGRSEKLTPHTHAVPMTEYS
jgi:hypothetical protein